MGDFYNNICHWACIFNDMFSILQLFSNQRDQGLIEKYMHPNVFINKNLSDSIDLHNGL